MTCSQGESSYIRTEEEEFQRGSRACSQSPPYLGETVDGLVAVGVVRKTEDQERDDQHDSRHGRVGRRIGAYIRPLLSST